MRVYLNPQYSIRNEKSCSYIVTLSTPVSEHLAHVDTFVSIVPPMIGYILSHIIDDDLENAEEKIAELTCLKVETIDNFIRKLIDNPRMVGWKLDGITISFPPFLLTSFKEKGVGEIFTDDEYSCFDKFIPKRPSIPLGINFMITTKCYTNCIYCYADRNRADDLSISEILKVLDEAHELGVINLTLSGGDIFAFPSWKEVVTRICQYHFSSFLSTKVPLCREDVLFLKNAGINSLQLSLDSLNPDTIKSMVQVKDYVPKMKYMLECCNELDIKINIRTVLTKYNANETEINNLLLFFKSLPNISSWVLTPAFYSAYKENYKGYRASDEDLISVFKLTQSERSNIHFEILYNKMDDRKYELQIYDSVQQFVKNNQVCNANTYSMSILSNGTVTACEMLYDNPHFIFGNTRMCSLYELWNSDTALKLYSYKQKMIEKKDNNPCVDCKVYDDCKLNPGKRVCYVDIAKVYGQDYYEYPDPRCPNALPHEDYLIL